MKNGSLDLSIKPGTSLPSVLSILLQTGLTGTSDTLIIFSFSYRGHEPVFSKEENEPTR